VTEIYSISAINIYNGDGQFFAHYREAAAELMIIVQHNYNVAIVEVH
jgi:hypothetical protein